MLRSVYVYMTNLDNNEILQGETGDAERAKEDKAQAILAIQKNQEMLQTKHELIKQAEEKRKTAMVQQEGLLKSKHVRRFHP